MVNWTWLVLALSAGFSIGIVVGRWIEGAYDDPVAWRREWDETHAWNNTRLCWEKKDLR